MKIVYTMQIICLYLSKKYILSTVDDLSTILIFIAPSGIFIAPSWIFIALSWISVLKRRLSELNLLKMMFVFWGSWFFLVRFSGSPWLTIRIKSNEMKVCEQNGMENVNLMEISV